MCFYLYICTFPFILWSVMGGNKQVVMGVNSDHVVTVYTLFSCTLLGFYWLIKRKSFIKRSHIFLLCLVVAYLVINIFVYNHKSITLITSHAVYIVISMWFIFFFKRKPIHLSYLIALGLLFVSSFLLIKLFQLGFGDWGRLTVPVFYDNSWSYFPLGYESSSDPNVLAFMLCIGSIYMFFTLPNKYTINIIFILSMMCSFLTLSRSSFLSFFISFLIVSVYSFFVLKKTQLRLLVLIMISLAMSFVVMKNIPAVVTENNGASFVTEPNITERIVSKASNSDRIARLKNAIVEISNLKTMFIGNGIGYSTLTQDPHNFYLSTIIDSGILILAIVMMVLTKPLLMVSRTPTKSNVILGCMFLTIYYMFISLFYWQVRVLYFVIILLFTFVNISKKSEQ
ncbi:Lipid A core - O-antigen ligase and related enzymes [Streptococcus pneumoniae]|jgi:hypothetical protein|nr:Lipid A core - O-antigen ligase and related enzymes [Streptococcus pneumoniae]